VLCEELGEQIKNVAKRTEGKDWAGRIFNIIWCEVQPIYIPQYRYNEIKKEYKDKVPRKDLAIFAAALAGKVDYLVSENREFIRLAAESQNLFKCMDSETFVREVLSNK